MHYLPGLLYQQAAYFSYILTDTIPSLELPDELLDMLINRSPHLEELHLESASFGAYRVFDFSRIARDGHWEMLRSFTISGLPLESSSFSTFLDLHTALVNLTIVRSHPHPSYEIVLLPAIEKAFSSPPLPNLTDYCGRYSSLAYLANPSSIRTLDISSEIISFDTDEISPSLFSHFTSLTSLSIWIHSVPVFESILSHCRALSTLDISCTNQPDIFWVSPIVTDLSVYTHIIKYRHLTNFSTQSSTYYATPLPPIP